MNYKESGVDIDEGNNFINNNINNIKSTYDDNVLISKNNFSGFYDISKVIGKSPILSVTCDGVGSKVKLASRYNNYCGLGQDLVAMNVNDIICSGAEPLLFLDYYATHKLDKINSNIILSGIVDACKKCNISLIGGETSEMPSIYKKHEFDLAGFCVGMLDKEDMIDPDDIKAGQAIIGIRSSGPHANGYSIINQLVNENTPEHIIDTLLRPTKLYLNDIKRVKTEVDILGIAHITGGGIPENLVRILPDNVSAYIVADLSLPFQSSCYNNVEKTTLNNIFTWIKETGDISKEEMRRVFNMSIGMIFVVEDEDKYYALNQLKGHGVLLGYTIKSTGKSEVFFKEYK